MKLLAVCCAILIGVISQTDAVSQTIYLDRQGDCGRTFTIQRYDYYTIRNYYESSRASAPAFSCSVYFNYIAPSIGRINGTTIRKPGGIHVKARRWRTNRSSMQLFVGERSGRSLMSLGTVQSSDNFFSRTEKSLTNSIEVRYSQNAELFGKAQFTVEVSSARYTTSGLLMTVLLVWIGRLVV